MTDSEFLNWLGDRLVHVYGESENVDFVLKVRSLARKAQVEPGPVTAEQKNALKEEGWRAAIDVHSRHGMAGWSSHKDAALSAAQPVAQPVVDQEPASVSHNGSCGSQVSGKPVSAEADRYKRALEAIIANPGGASAKRIATLALGLDGTEQVSAEAGKGDAFSKEELEVIASAVAAFNFTKYRQLFDKVTRLSSSQQREPQEAAEPWEDGNGVIRNGVLPDAPQEAGKVEAVAEGLVTEFENAVSWCTRYHAEYMGKAMPEDVYEKFSSLRDEAIPRLRAALLRPTQQALSDEEIIDLARVASTVNNYSNGRFASAIFEREHAIAFARAILAAAGGSEK